jgi:phage terminase small subunit|tara:strand:+ start:70 stop:582 length:513 start_codon:yes stop_codon:yes gene_type:complete
MPQKANIMKTSDEITTKQKAFVDILVENWGQISKKDAIIKAGFSGKNENSAMVMGSRLTNPSLNPHVCRYLEKRMAEEQSKYEKDKLTRYKTFERLRDGAEKKGQYTGAINAEFRSGQLAGLFVDKKEITHNTLEGMTREQLENRLKELEDKIGANTIIIEGKVEEVENV